MLVSIIGTGKMGTALVKTLSPQIQELLWGSRTPNSAQQLVEDLRLKGVRGVPVQDALTADVIFHTLWFRDLLPWAEENRGILDGKILVDIVNPFTDDFEDFTTNWGTSAAEELQKMLPGTRIVGAFKNTFAKVFDQPVHQGVISDVYVTSDDEKARLTVVDLLQGIPFRVMDAGRLANNRTIERMTLLERELARRHGHPGYVSFRLFGQD